MYRGGLPAAKGSTRLFTYLLLLPLLQAAHEVLVDERARALYDLDLGTPYPYPYPYPYLYPNPHPNPNPNPNPNPTYPTPPYPYPYPYLLTQVRYRLGADRQPPGTGQ